MSDCQPCVSVACCPPSDFGYYSDMVEVWQIADFGTNDANEAAVASWLNAKAPTTILTAGDNSTLDPTPRRLAFTTRARSAASDCSRALAIMIGTMPTPQPTPLTSLGSTRPDTTTCGWGRFTSSSSTRDGTRLAC